MKRTLITIAIAALAVFMMAGCGGSKSSSVRPDAQASSSGGATGEYPESQFMTATGTGQSEPEAKNQALAEMSRIFESKVRSQSMDRMRSVLSASGAEGFEQSIENIVRVESNVEFKGLEVPKVWKEGSTYKALAVLEKSKAYEEWKRRMSEIDAEADGQYRAAETSPSMLGKYRALNTISTLWVKRELYSSRINVLGMSAPSAPFEIGAVLREIPQMRPKMPVYIDIESEYSDLVRDTVGQALGKAGFVITLEEKEAAVIIDGLVNVEALDIPNQQNWKYARASASVSVIDAGTGQSVAEVTDNQRSAHLNYNEAAEKAARTIAPRIAEQVIVVFMGSTPRKAD